MRKISHYFAGFFVFCCLPVIGWSVFDLSGFLNNNYRLSFIIFMSLSMIFVVIFVPDEGSGSGEGKSTIKRQNLVIGYLKLITPALLILSPFSDRHHVLVLPESENLRIIGLILCAVGYFFMNWSILALGRQFSLNVTLLEDHKLISRGPYRIIRHPRYLGIMMLYLGLSLLFLSQIALILTFITFFVIIWRISDEEKLLQQQFGNEWDEYKKRTYNFIPYLF